MSITSRLLTRMYKLPHAETYDIAVATGLAVPMPDGVVLRADRYYPRTNQNLPTMLVRTPYGRRGYGAFGRLFAERGFQSVIQSCRGTDDSSGAFGAFRGERADGRATLAWLKQQDWFDGNLAMAGPSYLGFTQWAMARDAGPVLKAFSTQVTSSEFRSVMYPGESFNLDLFLGWMQITLSAMTGSLRANLRSMLTAGRRRAAAVRHLPLSEADVIAVGKPVDFWRDWLTHTKPNDEWWEAEDFSQGIAEITAPNHLISGWYDFMLPQLLRDYTSLERAGRKPYLTIGPWSHSSNELFKVCLNESLIWLRAHLLGETQALRTSPIRIYVMGAHEWRDMPSWPPQDVQTQRWYLHPKSRLSPQPAAESEPDQYRYDPVDPTPNVAGAINTTLGRGAGAKDNRALESRRDVLVFTSAPLEHAVEVIGPISAELFIHSNLEHTDVFVRLCDVHRDGKSMNVCDGIQRIVPNGPASEPEPIRKVSMSLWPTAHRFRKGHRIRIQVSSGAFPRFARNLGTGESLATGTAMRVAEQQIYHDSAHPSAVVLPVSQVKQQQP